MKWQCGNESDALDGSTATATALYVGSGHLCGATYGRGRGGPAEIDLNGSLATIHVYK